MVRRNDVITVLMDAENAIKDSVVGLRGRLDTSLQQLGQQVSDTLPLMGQAPDVQTE